MYPPNEIHSCGVDLLRDFFLQLLPDILDRVHVRGIARPGQQGDISVSEKVYDGSGRVARRAILHEGERFRAGEPLVELGKQVLLEHLLVLILSQRPIDDVQAARSLPADDGPHHNLDGMFDGRHDAVGVIFFARSTTNELRLLHLNLDHAFVAETDLIPVKLVNKYIFKMFKHVN